MIFLFYEAEAIFGLLMHIYGVTKKDEDLLKVFDYPGLTLDGLRIRNMEDSPRFTTMISLGQLISRI